jgi:hypothetical protein
VVIRRKETNLKTKDIDGWIIKMGNEELKVMDWFKVVQVRDRLWVVVNITK